MEKSKEDMKSIQQMTHNENCKDQMEHWLSQEILTFCWEQVGAKGEKDSLERQIDEAKLQITFTHSFKWPWMWSLRKC